MGFRGAAGRSVQQDTREELLAKARQEREIRAETKRQVNAVETIQRRVRQLGTRLTATWLTNFQQQASATAGAPCLTAQHLVDRVVPPILMAYAPYPPPHANLPLTPLRGCLSLLLRSMATGVAATHDYRSTVSAHQGARVVGLCCSVLGAPPAANDALLQLAAAQCLKKLTDPVAWQQRDASNVHKQLVVVATVSGAAARAVGRLLGLSEAAQAGEDPMSPHVKLQRRLQTTVLEVAMLLQASDHQVHTDKDTTRSQQWQQLVHHVLVSPHLAASGLVPSLAVSSFVQILQAVPLTASTMPRSALLWCFANLAVVAGRGAMVRVVTPEGRAVEYMEPSLLLNDPAVAEAYIRALRCLLRTAAEGSSQQAVEGGIVDIMQAVEKAAWPLTESSHAAQLLRVLGNDGVPAVASLYYDILVLMPWMNRASSAPTPKFLNALAFNRRFLPDCWRNLAHRIGLPLDAPINAAHGWDIPSLQQGVWGLTADDAAQLFVFCRCQAHFLGLVDDVEFYEGRDSEWTLGQHRAVATALNTLVFASYCRPHAKEQERLPAPQEELLHAAAALLWILYDRDCHRQFCPPALWTAPYLALPNRGAALGTLLQSDAVLRLLAAPGASNAGDQTSSSMRPRDAATLLRQAPQTIPFAVRLEVFRLLIAADKQRGKWSLAPAYGGPRPIAFAVQRGRAVECGMRSLSGFGVGVKGPLSITYIDAHGRQEAGIDHGGLLKEFLVESLLQGFDPKYGLFSTVEGPTGGTLYPSPLAPAVDSGLAALRHMGVILGKALYEGILVDMALAPFFITRLQGRPIMFDQLATLDPAMHANLLAVKRHEGDPADLCLDFTAERDTLGVRRVEELVPGGAQVSVSASNVLLYVHLMAAHVQGRVAVPIEAFVSGLKTVVPPHWLRMFSAGEVNELLGGGKGGEWDVEDLRRHTHYSGGYSDSSRTCRHFFSAVDAMAAPDRALLLRFVTSCPRPPLGGFRDLTPPFTLHKVDEEASVFATLGGADVSRLPSASTCFNMLKLPNYRRAGTLRDKLLYAIRNNTSGFELS